LCDPNAPLPAAPTCETTINLSPLVNINLFYCPSPGTAARASRRAAARR
jgi:hypothetical protein